MSSLTLQITNKELKETKGKAHQSYLKQKYDQTSEIDSENEIESENESEK